MPLTHQRTFRVRHSECDAYEYVRYAVYLDYMQETAFDASVAAGYDRARYEALDYLWLIRETDVEYLRPLRYGDSVQVKTWVADFRRVRSRRAYELRVTGSGELAARASTDWVFLDRATGRPVSIPPEMMNAFFPEGVPEQAPPRSRFPAASPPASSVFRWRRQVEWRDIDMAQHVNNAVYLSYLEDYGERALTSRAWPRARMQEQGFFIAARRHRIEYRQPALFGDALEVSAWLSDVETDTVVCNYTITRINDGALLVRTWMLWGTADAETGQPIPIPTGFLGDITFGVA